MAVTKKDVENYKMLTQSPLFFVEKVWGLRVQDIKPHYKGRLEQLLTLQGAEWEEKKHEICAEWFGDYDHEAMEWRWINFQKGKHITWQQFLILISMEKALKGEASKSISIASGRGIGKSTTLSWIILWFLFCHPDCQIPCTAPTSDQMYDVLWKELALWIHRMPPNIKSLYDWESSHIRITESPYTWFARAKTASKENPEALSGVHADWILAVVDEASAIEDPIFEAAQGIFSSPNPFFIMISNYTRLNGFFRDSHTRTKNQYQCWQFSGEESPIVHKDLLEKYATDGKTSDRYRVNVLGLPPKEDSIDDKSYVQLLHERFIKTVDAPETVYNNPILGVDPAGEGDNETAFCIRDNFQAEILGTEATSSAKSVARNIMTFCDKYKINNKNIMVDSFGVGADVGKEVALAVRWNIGTVNVGERPDSDRDKEMFLNKKAEMYWKMKQWFEQGGSIVDNKKLKEQLLSIRFRRTLNGKIEIMQKKEMRKLGLPSPDLADALALTFLVKPANELAGIYEEFGWNSDFDPYEVI